ncbi:MAG: thioredoxin family protein [Chloroflexi bacterium]|nr:thioredoxin family protein [Chloroflexota bacterium]
MAIENPHVKADVVEASEFPQMVEKYHVMGVPKVVINDKVEFEGAVPEDRYLQQVLKAAQG